MAKTKAGGGINWIGTTSDDIKIGSDGSDIIRGSAGSDTLTGGKSSDRFVFESSLSLNGVDAIKDFSVKSSASPFNYDVLDLSLALSKNKKITSSNINDYVYVAGDKLYVDLDGKGSGTAEVWATLEGVKVGDQLNVSTSSFDAWITARAPEGDAAEPIFNPNVNYSYNYLENQEAGGIVATVVGASDNLLVTQYRFVDSGGVVSGNGATSSDGFFAIASDGKVTMTAAGVAAAVNDFESGSNANPYYIQAGDAAGNWSLVRQIILNETNDVADDQTIPNIGGNPNTSPLTIDYSAAKPVGVGYDVTPMDASNYGDVYKTDSDDTFSYEFGTNVTTTFSAGINDRYYNYLIGPGDRIKGSYFWSGFDVNKPLDVPDTFKAYGDDAVNQEQFEVFHGKYDAITGIFDVTYTPSNRGSAPLSSELTHTLVMYDNDNRIINGTQLGAGGVNGDRLGDPYYLDAFVVSGLRYEEGWAVAGSAGARTLTYTDPATLPF